MSSKGRQQVSGGLGRELAVALEGSVAAGRDAAVQAAERAAQRACLEAQAAVRACLEAQAAARAAQRVCNETLAAARDAQEYHRQLGEVRVQINAMLEQHAAETSRVVGRGVLCCAFIALLELVPMLVLLWMALLR